MAVTALGSTGMLPFSEAKLLIEHNATAADTGFQGFVDGEPWAELSLIGPDGTVLAVEAQGQASFLGFTELFFETQEPPNAVVPIENVLATLPEGKYSYVGTSIDGIKMKGTARLTHDIPAAPVITSPPEGAQVDPQNLVIDWEEVTESVMGETIDIVAYQVIVEKDAESRFGDAFANRVMSVHVSPSVTSMSIPPEFLEPATPYKCEVLAIEKSGNQTISECSFETLP